MKLDHSDKVFADAEAAKGPLDKPEKKAADGVSEEKKETEWVICKSQWLFQTKLRYNI